MKQTDGTPPAVQERQGGFLNAYRQTLPAVIRHPSTWLLTLLWLGAAMYLLALGRATLASILLTGLYPIALALLTIPLTQVAPPAPWDEPTSSSPSRLWLQCGFTVLCSILVGLTTLLASLHIISFLSLAFLRTHVLLTIVLALLLEVVLPLAFVLLSGAGWRELGFQKGYHIWRVTALWCAVPALLLVISIAAGKVVLLSLLLRIVTVFLQAGLPEEVAWRGIIMSRLNRLVGTGWAIALSSLLFGFSHLGIDIVQTGSTSFFLILAITIYGQMPGGIFYAIIFQRTCSLIPGIIAHTLGDALAL